MIRAATPAYKRGRMKNSMKTGFSFGLTSGVITTLGLMVGLHAGTHSTLAVTGGIITIAIADAFSDALGLHISAEAENTRSTLEIWEVTLATFVAKMFFPLTFLVPLFFLELPRAILASAVWGLGLLCLLSYRIAREQGTRPWAVIGEHVGIALVVIAVTHYVGDWISAAFS